MKKELCVGTLEGARLASSYALDRIETCACLEVGGLTPTTAMVKWIDQTLAVEQHVLIRQRAGDFVYNYDEIVVMRDQISEMKALGIQGVVVGALLSDHTVNKEALEVWKRAAGDMDLTFHRAFDEVNDWKGTIDVLVNLGFKRILTSGVCVSSSMTDAAKELVDYAKDRIEIMMGGGLQLEDVPAMKAIGVAAVHFSGTTKQWLDEGGMFQFEALIPNEERISRFKSL